MLNGWLSDNEKIKILSHSENNIHIPAGVSVVVKYAVEGIVSTVQIKQNLSHLVIVQLLWGRHLIKYVQPVTNDSHF